MCPAFSDHLTSEMYGFPKGQPLPWEELEKIGRKEIKGYLKYNRKKKDWEINDRWIRSAIHHIEDVRLEDQHLSKKERWDLPYDYWLNIDMPRIIKNKRIKELLTKRRDKEDEDKRSGKYTKEEWKDILRTRVPISSADRVRRRNILNEIEKDSYVIEAESMTDFHHEDQNN